MLYLIIIQNNLQKSQSNFSVYDNFVVVQALAEQVRQLYRSIGNTLYIASLRKSCFTC